jgi:hypothetical protein
MPYAFDKIADARARLRLGPPSSFETRREEAALLRMRADWAARRAEISLRLDAGARHHVDPLVPLLGDKCRELLR